MIDNKVRPFKTGITLSRKSLVDIQRDNAAYGKFKAAKKQADGMEATAESAYAFKQKQDLDHRTAIIPNVVRNLSNKYASTMPEIILREYFTTFVSESLVWDTEAVQENMAGIRYTCHKYIAALGGLKAVKEAAIKNKSTYLGHVYDVCMEAGKNLAKKKSDKLKKDINADNVKNQKIDFSIETADQDDINKRIKDLDVDNLSEMVKDKVLQVVKDENESQKQDDVFIQDLKSSVQALDGKVGVDDPNATAPADNTDANGNTADADGADYGAGVDSSGDAGEGTTESFVKYAYRGKVDIQHSLFRSMVSRSYRSALAARVAKEGAHASIVAAHTTENNSDPLDSNIRNQPTNLNIYDIYLNDGGEDLGYIDFIKNSDEIALAGDDTTIDNDEILGEALGLYTIIECASTIKLINPDERTIRRAIALNDKK